MDPSESNMSELERTVDALQARIGELEAREQRTRRTAKRRLFWAGLALASLGLATALAQPGVTSLITFSPNTPARAGDVNDNFSLLQTWLERKVVTVCSGAACDVDVNGDVGSTSGTSTGNVQGTTITGTAGPHDLTGTTNVDTLVASSTADFQSGLDVTSGDLSVTDGTLIEGGITSSCGNDGSGSDGCVLDDDGASSPHGRVSADSFHTNGLGDGQIYIEGGYIDANTTIRIGTGVAGGQSAATVQFDYNGSFASRPIGTADASATSVGSSSCDESSEIGKMLIGRCVNENVGGNTFEIDCFCYCGNVRLNSSDNIAWRCIYP